MLRIMSTISILLFLGCVSNAQIKSVYTKMDEKSCKTMKPGPEENVLYNGRCPGAGGYKLAVAASDEHQWVELVSPRGKKFDVGLQPAAYDSLGKTAEWRVRNGKPIAVIIRFDLRQEYGGKVTESLLVISKITANKPALLMS